MNRLRRNPFIERDTTKHMKNIRNMIVSDSRKLFTRF